METPARNKTPKSHKLNKYKFEKYTNHTYYCKLDEWMVGGGSVVTVSWHCY